MRRVCDILLLLGALVLGLTFPIITGVSPMGQPAMLLDPVGGTMYGSGNTMSRSRPEAHLAFVLDIEAEVAVEWLPCLLALPQTGGAGRITAWATAACLAFLLGAVVLGTCRHGGRESPDWSAGFRPSALSQAGSSAPKRRLPAAWPEAGTQLLGERSRPSVLRGGR